MMRRRRMDRLGLDISECTFGTAALSRAGADGVQPAAVLSFALDEGINAVEVCAADLPVLERVGAAIRASNAAAQVHIFARMRPARVLEMPSSHIYADQAYPSAQLRGDVDTLLRLLGVERLAAPMLHGWCAEWLGEGEWSETFDALRREGKIAGCGISLFDHDSAAGLDAAVSGRIDCIQVMYNIFDPAPAAQLLPLCREHCVGVIARAPHYYGAFGDKSGPGTFAAGDWRQTYFYDAHRSETARRVGALAAHAAPDDGIASLALRFALSNPAVSTVALGMRSSAQVRTNLAAAQAGPLPPDTLKELSRHAWLC